MGRLIERLQASPVICAEGYLFELERRGYLQAGAFVPEVVLEHPDAVLQLHREHLRAGSDVMVAFTYYGHRDKLRIIGKEDLLEPLNKNALALAKQAAAEDESGRVLVAGNICNTNIYDPAAAEKTGREATAMFEEQIGWARDAGVDFILAETFSFHEEAMLALQACKRAGMEAVVNVVSHATGKLRDGPTPAESCKMLEDAGAEVVGMNCNRGPATMWPLLVEIRQAVACEVAAIPVPFRTNVPKPPLFNRCATPKANRFCPRACARFRSRSMRAFAPATRWAISRAAASTTAFVLSAFVAAAARTMSARWPRRWGGDRPRRATRPTCRSITRSATTRRSSNRTAIFWRNCDRRRAPLDD